MNSKPLILFIGNYLFRDDKVSLLVGEKLKPVLENEGFEVEIMDKSGLPLIDYIEGRELAIIVDSVVTSKHPVGEVVEVDIDEVGKQSVWSPHYMNLSETLKVMKELGIPMPREIQIIGIEVSDVYTISEEVSEQLKEKLEEITRKVYDLVKKKTFRQA
ncbi:MAG: hydrogenase maturation protease [Nitrososphaerota archaeon]